MSKNTNLSICKLLYNNIDHAGSNYIESLQKRASFILEERDSKVNRIRKIINDSKIAEEKKKCTFRPELNNSYHIRSRSPEDRLEWMRKKDRKIVQDRLFKLKAEEKSNEFKASKKSTQILSKSKRINKSFNERLKSSIKLTEKSNQKIQIPRPSVKRNLKQAEKRELRAAQLSTSAKRRARRIYEYDSETGVRKKYGSYRSLISPTLRTPKPLKNPFK